MSILAGRRPGVAREAAGLIFAVASALSPARAAADVTFHIAFVETHDRKGPDPHPDIVRNHEIQATLRSDGHVSEETSSVGSGGGGGHRHHGGGGGADFGSNSEQLGDSSGKITWRVKGPHELQRIWLGPQLIVVAEIMVKDDKTCSASVRYLLKAGVADMYTRRKDNGELAHFTVPRVMSAQCEIQ